jgi:NDP-sugar pyrophosphorylase family protein
MKAVILAAGRGKRLHDHTEGCNKCMLKFQGRHLIEYSLEAARKSDADEIIIVVGYRAEDIINRYGISYKDIKIKYVIQKELKGLVSAIESTQEAVAGDDFILFLADEILLHPSPRKMIDIFYKEELFTICGVVQVEDTSQISKTYAVIFNQEDNRIYRLIEKPRHPVNKIMGTGNCVFRNKIFDYIPLTPINQVRNEKELPDLIQSAIDDGHPVKLFYIDKDYININTEDDIAIAERMFQA